MLQIGCPHLVAEIIVAIRLDDIGDFTPLSPLSRANPMPAIYEFVVLVDLNRGQRVEDIRVLRDQIVVALSEARVQIIAEHDVVEGNHLWGVHIEIVA